MSGQPVYPTFGNNMATQQAGGSSSGTDWMQWLGPLLNFGGNLLGGIGQGQQAKDALNVQAQEFGQQMDMARNAMSLSAANQLNRAPLADKGQYLALNAAAPTAFQPRDYTQGMSQLRGQPSGGAAAQLQANQIAANNYRPGAGGVDTSTLNLVLHRLNGATPQTDAKTATTTVNYGGQQYTPEQWSAYLNAHPELQGKGY